MKPIHIFFVFLGFIVLASIAAFANMFVRNKAANDSTAPTLDASGNIAPTTTPLDYNKKLGVGSKGAEVKELQRLYNNSSYASTKLVEDGIWGAKTSSALIFVMGFGVFSTTLAAFSEKIKGSTVDSKTKGFLESLGLKTS